MSVKIRNSIRDPEYMRKIIDKKMQESIKIMADDIYKRAKELEPSPMAQKTFADKLRAKIAMVIGNKDD